MAKRTKASRSEESAPFIVGTLKDSRFLEEHAKLFLHDTSRAKIEAKNNIQSELNVGVGKSAGKPDTLIVLVRLTVDSVEAADDTKQIAQYSSVIRHIYEIAHVYGELDVNAIHIGAVQPYVHLAVTVSAARAREAFSRLGMPTLDIPINTSFELTKP